MTNKRKLPKVLRPRKPAKKITATKKDFALAVEDAERREPTPTLRYYIAKGLLALARTLRHLAYRIAS